MAYYDQQGGNYAGNDYNAGGQAKNNACFKCGETGHFSRNCPQGGGGGQRNDNRGDRSCFKCGNSGHIARDCTEPGNGRKDFGGQRRGGYDNRRGGGFNRDGGRRDNNRPSGCFNCGEEGHFSRDCPKPQKARGGDRGGDRGGQPRTCYKCQKTGHIAKDCREGSDEDRSRSRERGNRDARKGTRRRDRDEDSN